uniref:hemagglutinin repeat-containing protein n=1 Tax=Lelliottia wanjuensis TaxID=3050585 RepID=UPI00390821B3
MTPGGKTTMDQAGNGVPVVNIAPPNEAGISHNQFNSYNVGKEGVILNNATDRLTQTQLGGLIQNNPNLVAGKEAKGIINEVTGGSRSQLQGYTEVGGKAASVMVANPYGITCNGCGFINTPNVTLTTGKPQFDANGNLLALDVSKGAITIEGQGLDASQSDALSIIARATEVNAAIHARDLTVTAGANRVGADGSVKAIAGEGAAPVIAVDTSALGGMYANRIRLVSSDKGVGVNLGNLNARQGDIQLDANGKLTVTNSLASGAITAKGAGVTLNGSHQSGGALNVASSQDIALNNSTLVSGGEMRLTNDGKLQMSGGSATSKAALTVNSGQDLTLNNATLGSDTQTTLTSGGTLAATGSAVSAGKNLALKGQQLALDNRSRADAAGNIDLSGERITSQGQLNAGGDLTSVSQQLDNSGLMAAKGRASVQADGLTNSGTLQGNGVTLAGKNVINSGTVQSGGQLQVSAGTLNQQGTLTAKGDAELNASESLRNSGSVVADGALRAKAGALVQNGVFSGAKALTADADILTSGKDSRTTSQGNIQLTAAQLADLNGQTDAAGALSVSGKNLTTRADAHLQSGQDLTLQANSADLGGVQAAKGALRASAQNLDHSGTSTAKTLSFGATDGITQRGELTANAIALNGQRINQSGKAKADSITLTAPDAIANSGTLVADALTLDGKQITNNGLLQGNSLLNLRASTLDNLTGGAIYSARNLTLNLPELNNSGLITTDADLGWQGNTLTNSGEINGVNLRLDGNSLTNQAAGRLLADDALNVKGSRLLNDGQIAAKNLQLTGNTLQNQGVMQGYDILTLNADEVTNGGAMRSDGTLTLRVATLTNSGELSATNLLLNLSRQMQNNSSGQIIARNGLTLATPELVNNGLLAGANVQLNAGTIANSGTLQGTTALTATGTQLNNQQNGKVLSGGDVRLQNDKFINAGLLQGKTLNLATGEWINSGNALGEAGITATIAKSLTNDGNVLSQQKLDLNAANINNRGQLLAKVLTLRGDLQNSGLLQGSSALTWTGGGLTNQPQGQITGGETLTLSGKSLSNQGQIQARDASVTADAISNSGSVQALDRLTLNAGGRLDNQGTLLSQNLFELTAAQLFNDGQLAAKTLTLTTPQLTNNGILQGNDGLTLTTRSLTNGQNGQLVSGGALALDLDKLENHGLTQVNQRLTVKGNDLLNSGDIQADALEMTLHNTLNNQGGLVAKNDAALNATTLTNGGTLAGKTLTLGATEIRNSGLIQGNDRAEATAGRISNDAAGKWLSGGALTLNGGTLSNAGALQGENLGLTGASLDNSGAVNGLKGLTGNLSGKITNTGLLQSGGAVKFTADSLLNPGRVMGKTLTLNARELNNSGLWQGTDALTLTGDSLVTGAASKTLTGGALTLDVGQLTTQGTLQGNGVTVTADGWTHGGSLLSQGALTASVGGTLTSTGALMSQGDTAITAQTLDNRGQLLGEGDMRLGGTSLKNSGAVQGKTLALRQTSINNQGTLTGLQSLTLKAQQQLMARMAMAAPQLELINGASGALLTQGTLNITSGMVTNNGSWQGQNILLDAQSLTNNGAVQSADALQMTLATNLTNGAGSKITALGTATLQAMSLNNQGQWAAKNLTLKGTTLANSGAISGVNGLTLAQTGAITQQQNGTMLTGGALNLNAASLANDGKIQGATLGVTSGALTNNGRLQGDNGATFSLSGALTNNAGGEIVSRQGLTVTTPSLFNYGLMQGGGETNVTANTQARNDGKLLSGARLTLTTPQFTGAGWLQATNLILNAATATNGGTWLADQATLTGNTLVNQGTTQAGTLAVNYGQLTNSGTLLGNSQLTIDADQVTQSAAGKLLSGGDLWLESKGLDAVGQLVSLGNLTLKLTNAFTGKTAIAAGKTLSISTNGAIENRSVMQGQAVNLTAGGELTNNGQLTTGSGASALSGSTVALNGAGTIQGGGDIAIASRGNITVDGFTGTRGSLTLSAPGSIINTALLYAANNLALYANSITNQRGDILAGNNLWMQKDAAGNANSEVVNTSGNIETTRGDITIKTASLLNQRDGLTVTESEINNSNDLKSTIKVNVLDAPHDRIGYYTDEHCSGGRNEHCIQRISFYVTGEDVKTVLVKETAVTAMANGSAARLSSGRNIVINAGVLNNKASLILANGDIWLTGGSLNNFSAESSKTSLYGVYKYNCGDFSGCSDKISGPLSNNDIKSLASFYNRDVDDVNFLYTLQTDLTEVTVTEPSALYRSVIQAGGNVNANFTDNISNTNTTANAGGVSNTISAPTLNTLSNQSIGSGTQKQNLANTGVVAVNSPQWNDQLQGALQQINGGGALDSSGASSASLSNISTSQKGNASLGQLNELAKAGITTADLNTAKGGATGQYQGKTVDTSAYPLPSGNNGYFVVSDNPKSPYLINVNPKLNGLGQLDPALFADLNKMLGTQPSTSAPQETRPAFTDEKQVLGSSYMLGRLNLTPDYDYRFLGDAAFDTRYVSNTVLNQTGSRYLNGVGSDLDQMRYLMDSAAAAQQSLGLQFGVSLTADQIASLDHSILWWEKATINGETVMVPKVYLSPKDVTVNNGSVIAGNNVSLTGGNITNSGSTLVANNSLTLDSQNSISNLNNGLIKAGGDLNLNAIGDINNISSTISGKTVQLASLDGSINNLTLADQIDINAKGKYSNVSIKDTVLGTTASITAQDSLSLEAGKNITVTGANLASGGDMLLNAWGDIAVNANKINDAYSSSQAKTSRSSVTYQGSTVNAGGNLSINAGNNIDLSASDLKAGGSAGLNAGKDLNLNAQQTSTSSGKGKSESHSTGVDRTTISTGDNLVLKAGQDINSQAAALAAEKDVGIQAGRDVNLEAQATGEGDSYKSSKKTVINESVRQQGTEIASGGNTVVIAGRDVNSEAAQVTAQGDIGVVAGRDVNLTTATESDYYYKEQTKTKSGFLSKKTTHTIEESSATHESGTLLSGDNVQVAAGNNLLVKGSGVVGDDQVTLRAGNNVDIVAATNSNTDWRFKEEKKSGLMGSSGIGFTIGSSKSTHDLREKGTTQSQSFSTVGSTGGNVDISAGNQAHIGGADLVAGKDLNLSGSSVIIEPGHDKRTRDETFEQKKSGLTVALSGTVGGAINNAVSAAQDAHEESDGRLAALQATKTALSGVQAGQAVDMAATTGDPNALGVALSLTTQKSKSEQHAQSDAVTGSTLNAGNNLSITANGKGHGPNSGDIMIAGSQLKAGGDTTLDAQNDILLSGAANTQQSSGKNSSSGGGVGVSIGGGGNGAGISVFANVNAAHGKDKGNGTDWTETTIDSGKTVTIKSGNDTVLDGAQVNGNKIVADVGHDLLMSSQQDTNKYDSKQTSVAAGGSFTFGTMSGSGYINASQDKMKSRFDSVAEQTGLFAGDGGFDITVGNHTQLDGAVIASTATADKNSLDTGTLGFTDLHNEADFKTQHSGISLSGGGSFGDEFQGNMPGGMISAAGNKGHAEGTTQAAIADGTITIRDKASQKQDVADLSRDTEHANDSISPIFDKEKEQNRLKEVGMISDIGSQVADIARTQGDLNALKKAQSDSKTTLPANATEKERLEYLAGLRNSQAYKDEMQKYGTGSDIQRGIQAATAALQGLAGGNIGGALAGASAPELAHLLKSTEGDPAVNAIAHAILGGAVAAIQGNSAAAGAVGAASGEVIARAIAGIYYPDVKMSDLTEDQKQTISSLASISAGIAGGLAGGNTAGAATGAGAGKNAVENNFLSKGSPQKYTEQYKECNGNTGCEQNVRKDMAQESAENIQKLKSCWDGGDAACVAETRSKIELNENAYTELRQQDNMAGRAYEDSAKWYADIIDQCAGKCDWLEASLLKTGAEGLGNLAYGALGAGSLPKLAQNLSANDLKVASEISKDIASVGKQTDIGFAAKQTKRSAGQIVIKNLNPSEAIENLSANGYTKSISKDGSVTIMTQGEKVYRFYPSSTGGGISGAESGVPSASVSVNGKIISKLRFPGE